MLGGEASASACCTVLRLGNNDEGELRRLGAPGHPQEECSVSKVVDSGEL